MCAAVDPPRLSGPSLQSRESVNRACRRASRRAVGELMLTAGARDALAECVKFR